MALPGLASRLGEIEQALDEAVRELLPRYLETSVLQVVHRYLRYRRDDVEVLALVCALYDFGKDDLRVLTPMMQGFLNTLESSKLGISNLAETEVSTRSSEQLHVEHITAHRG